MKKLFALTVLALFSFTAFAKNPKNIKLNDLGVNKQESALTIDQENKNLKVSKEPKVSRMPASAIFEGHEEPMIKDVDRVGASMPTW